MRRRIRNVTYIRRSAPSPPSPSSREPTVARLWLAIYLPYAQGEEIERVIYTLQVPRERLAITRAYAAQANNTCWDSS